MIRLWRGASPDRLAARSEQWTNRWLEIHGRSKPGDWLTQAAKRTLYPALKMLAYGKCAYCESILELTSYLEIEHYTAKAVQPVLAFEWNNLFPVCRLCNGKKRSTDHGGQLLKPDMDDPETVLWLNPDTGKLEPRAGLDPLAARRVEATIEICNLQRGALCSKRIEMMTRTIHWLERAAERKGKPLDAKLKREWDALVNPKTEHKFVIRHVFETRGEPRLAEYDRAVFKDGAI